MAHRLKAVCHAGVTWVRSIIKVSKRLRTIKNKWNLYRLELKTPSDEAFRLWLMEASK